MALHAAVAVAAGYALTWLAARSTTGSIVAGVVAGGLLLRVVYKALTSSSKLRALVGIVVMLAISAVGVLVLNALRPVASEPAAVSASGSFPVDPVGDCPGCRPADDISGFSVRATDAGTELGIAFAAPVASDARIWVWLEAAPVHPLLLERGTDGSWTATASRATPVDLDGVTVEVDGGVLTVNLGGAAGPLAVVSAGGDRAPDIGAAGPGQADVAEAAGSNLGDELLAAVAEIQSGFPRLDELQQQYVRTVLARQLLPGTYRYDLRLAGRPDLTLVADVTVRFPELAQVLSVVRDGEETAAQSILALEDGTSVCTWFTDGSARCEDGGGVADLPMGALLALVRDPASVTVEEAPARDVGEVARCFRVVATTPDGPPEGESCSLADGTLAVNDNERTGVRLVLIERSPAVSADAFVLP